MRCHALLFCHFATPLSSAWLCLALLSASAAALLCVSLPCHDLRCCALLPVPRNALLRTTRRSTAMLSISGATMLCVALTFHALPCPAWHFCRCATFHCLTMRAVPCSPVLALVSISLPCRAVPFTAWRCAAPRYCRSYSMPCLAGPFYALHCDSAVPVRCLALPWLALPLIAMRFCRFTCWKSSSVRTCRSCSPWSRVAIHQRRFRTPPRCKASTVAQAR